MATKEEWVKLFESTMGRKPTADEYTKAMGANFGPAIIAELASAQAQAAPQAEQTAPSPRDNWAHLFETTMGRKPTADEFMQAKATGFDSSQIPTNEGVAPVQDPVVTQEAQPQETTSQEVQEQAVVAPQETAPATEVAMSQAQDFPQQEQNVEQPVQPQATFEQQASQPQAQVSPVNPAIPEQSVAQAQDFQQAAYQQQNMAQIPGALPVNQPKKSGLVVALVLPIVSLVLAVLFTGLSFTPLAWVFFALAILNFVGAGVLLFFNRKGKKVLSIIASAVALLSIIISLVGAVITQTHSTSTNSSAKSSKVKKSDVKDNSTDVNDYMDSDAGFDWKESDIEDVKLDKDTVSDVIAEHGKAHEAEISKDTLVLRYQEGNKFANKKYVEVSFKKQYDGTWTADYVSSRFPADDIETSGESYSSDWSKADFDALKKGDYDTGEGGTKWSDIKDKHGKPSDAYYTIDKFSNDDVEKTLRIEYTDYDSADDKANTVWLDFRETSDGTYCLASKYGSGAGISNDD